MRKINLKGKKFGSWTVIEQAERPPTNSPSKPLYWKCQCKCGKIRIIPSHNLRCKRTLSCGHDYEMLPYKSKYNHLLSCCKKRNINNELSFEDFLEFINIKKCHYCGDNIGWPPRGNPSYKLDRKDNSGCYTKENCVVCCTRCNFGKSNKYSYEEWYGMTKYFRDKQKIEEILL